MPATQSNMCRQVPSSAGIAGDRQQPGRFVAHPCPKSLTQSCRVFLQAWLATGSDLGGSLRMPAPNPSINPVGSPAGMAGDRQRPGRLAAHPGPQPLTKPCRAFCRHGWRPAATWAARSASRPPSAAWSACARRPACSRRAGRPTPHPAAAWRCWTGPWRATWATWR